MSNQNPSQVHHMHWVNCLETSIFSRYPNNDGKWMMFFHMSEMDAKWNEACQLYRSGKLFGVNSMKASTAKQNPFPQRLHGYDEGIIIFYCGPSEDRHNVMEYGKNILNNIHYSRSYFYYKSDKAHLINHDRPYKNMYSIDTDKHYRDFAYGRKNANYKETIDNPSNYISRYNTNEYEDTSFYYNKPKKDIARSKTSLGLGNIKNDFYKTIPDDSKPYEVSSDYLNNANSYKRSQSSVDHYIPNIHQNYDYEDNIENDYGYSNTSKNISYTNSNPYKRSPSPPNHYIPNTHQSYNYEAKPENNYGYSNTRKNTSYAYDDDYNSRDYYNSYPDDDLYEVFLERVSYIPSNEYYKPETRSNSFFNFFNDFGFKLIGDDRFY